MTGAYLTDCKALIVTKYKAILQNGIASFAIFIWVRLQSQEGGPTTLPEHFHRFIYLNIQSCQIFMQEKFNDL